MVYDESDHVCTKYVYIPSTYSLPIALESCRISPILLPLDLGANLHEPIVESNLRPEYRSTAVLSFPGSLRGW